MLPILSLADQPDSLFGHAEFLSQRIKGFSIDASRSYLTNLFLGYLGSNIVLPDVRPVTVSSLSHHVLRILGRSRNPKMPWVEAAWCVAGVNDKHLGIKVESHPEGSRDSVHSHVPARRKVRYGCLSVASWLARFRPYPATSIVDFAVREESLLQDLSLFVCKNHAPRVYTMVSA